MYPNILVSIFIALIALAIIGGILNSPRLVKAAGVLLVVEAAVAVILWLLLGLSPVPPWFPRWVSRLVHTFQRAAHR
jgi:hypothetical protein